MKAPVGCNSLQVNASTTCKVKHISQNYKIIVRFFLRGSKAMKNMGHMRLMRLINAIHDSCLNTMCYSFYGNLSWHASFPL